MQTLLPPVRSPRGEARVAGALYILVILLGGFAEVAVRQGLIVGGDPAATAKAIMANESLYRLGFCAEMLTNMIAIPLTLVMYRILAPAGRFWVLLAVLFDLTQNTINAVNAWTQFAPLTLLSGSPDVAALQTSAIREQDHYVLNGEKTWISNAGVAHCYIVFARTGEAPGAKGLSAFIVNADTAGFSVPENLTMVAPHVIGRVSFKDCKIPLSARLGGAGDGFKVAMSTLDIMRSTVGAAAVGFARRAMMETLIHTQNRQVFGQNLSAFQSTQMRLADMAIEVDSAALLVYRAAWTKDTLRDRITLEASMAKLQATEAAQRVIDSAVQLFGGLGVTAGSVTERLYREIRPLRIYEGASEIQKLIICAALLK